MWGRWLLLSSLGRAYSLNEQSQQRYLDRHHFTGEDALRVALSCREGETNRNGWQILPSLLQRGPHRTATMGEHSAIYAVSSMWEEHKWTISNNSILCNKKLLKNEQVHRILENNCNFTPLFIQVQPQAPVQARKTRLSAENSCQRTHWPCPKFIP